MVERSIEQGPIEKRGGEQPAEQHLLNTLPLSEEAFKALPKTRQLIESMHSQEGYEDRDAFAERQQALRDRLDSLKKYNATNAAKDLAYAEFRQIEPAVETMSAVLNSKIDDQVDAAMARIKAKVQAMKESIAKQEYMQTLPKREENERAQRVNRYAGVKEQELKELQVADSLASKETAISLGRPLVASVSDVVVPRSVEDAENDIAVENQAAASTTSGVTVERQRHDDVEVDVPAEMEDDDSTDEGVPLIAAIGSGMFGSAEERNARLEAVRNRPETGPENNEIRGLGALATEATTEKKGWRNRVKDKWNKLSKNEKRVAKVVGAAGALAVGALVYHLANNHGVNVEHHKEAVKQVHSHVKNAFQMNIFKGHGVGRTVTDVFGEAAKTARHATDVTSAVTPEHAHHVAPQVADHVTTISGQTGSDVLTVVTEPLNHAHPHIATMTEGSSASGIAHDYVVSHFSNASQEQINQLTGIGWEHLLHSNGLTAADARHIGAGSTFDASSMVQHINGAAHQMGLARVA